MPTSTGLALNSSDTKTMDIISFVEVTTASENSAISTIDNNQQLESLTHKNLSTSSGEHHNGKNNGRTGDSNNFEVIRLVEKILIEEKLKLLSFPRNVESGNISKEIERDVPSETSNCSADINTFILAAKLRAHWALQMIDAAGKPGPGVLRENSFAWGDFDECMDIDTRQDFQSRYCTTTMVISKIRDVTVSTPVSYFTGLCVPSSCNSEDLDRLLDAYFQSHPDVVARPLLTKCRERHLPLTSTAIVVTCILSIYTVLLVVATVYDVIQDTWIKRRKDAGTEKQNRENVTLAQTSTTLIGNDQTDLMKEQMCTSNNNSGRSDNGENYMDESPRNWTFMVIMNGSVSVDSFFAISGFLMTYNVLAGLSKKTVTPRFFGNFFLHRLWRLTPPYMAVLMIYHVLFKYMHDGPIWLQEGSDHRPCGKYWWANLLYINNFFNDRDPESCMGWTWYMACEMQCYIISPLLFLPMFYYDWLGLLVPVIALIANATYVGVLVEVKDFIAGSSVKDVETESYDDNMQYYFNKPYGRIGPYICGMICGFLMFKGKTNMPRILVVMGWTTATATSLAILYGLSGHVVENPLSTEVSALYIALHRIGWGICTCWIIYACANGYGGFINTFLSWRAMIPLSKLTFCAYLVHPIVILMYLSSQRKPFYVDNISVAVLDAGAIVVSYFVAFVVSLAFEVPMTRVEKVIRGQQR